MAGVGSKLKNWLHCAVCQDVVKQPKTLTCFHSFCEECVRQLKKTSHTDKAGVNCPVCRAFTEESMVKTNFLVNELLETHTGNQSGKSSLCEMCLKETSGWKCIECKMFLCDNCRVPHPRVPMCRGHHVVKAGEETDLAIDRLVFCNKHTDQPVIFNCKECEVPLCIKCKVTKHDKHNTETVEDTLERVLPEMEGYNEKIKVLISNIDENKDELDIREGEIKATFTKCRQDGKQKLQSIIDTATEDYNALVKELDIKEEEEFEKLRLDKQKEYERILEWMKTCNETAKGVTLMEQVQSGLCRRMKQIAEMKPIEMSNTRLKLPHLIINEGKPEAPENVIGRIQYKPSKILAKQRQLDSKNPEMPFKEILRQDLKVIKETDLKGRCQRMSFICGDIWAAVPDNSCIQVIDVDGNIQREIACGFQPYSAKESPLGDIIVAGTSGLLVMLPDGTVSEAISKDTFYDVAFFEDEILSLNQTKGVLQYFCKSEEGKWTHGGDIKTSKGTGCNNWDSVVTKGKNILFTMLNVNYAAFYRCEGKTGHRVDLKSDKRDLCYPFLCGIDSTDAVLVADYNNKVFQVHDQDNQWSVISIPCISSHYPFDVLYHPESDNVWVVTYANKIIKLG